MHPKHAGTPAPGEPDWVGRILAAPEKAVRDVVQAMTALGYPVGTSSETVARELRMIIAGEGRDGLTDLVGQVVAALMIEAPAPELVRSRLAEVHLAASPWIIVTCPDDETARREGGKPTSKMECAICGAVRTWQYEVLPPEWWTRGIDPARLYAELQRAGDAWAAQHAHPQLCDRPPAIFWARPLRNPRGWNIDWPAIGRRLFEDLGWRRGALQ